MYPNRTQYRESVHLEKYPLDKNGDQSFSPVTKDNEMVIASGGVAVVFKVTDKHGKLKALKLFTAEITERFERLESLSAFLKSTHLKGLVDFNFTRELIYVEMEKMEENDSFFPGLVMDWVEAPTLDRQLNQLIAEKDRQALLKLADNFKDLIMRLQRHNVGHGDLKPSNIMVRKNLDISLIDYDDMFIEEFKGMESFELGTPGYQHPARNKTDFHAGIDHFSILVIYTSLIALAYYPELYDYTDGESMIIRNKDIDDPSKSEIFSLLYQKAETKQLAYHIRKSLKNDFIEIKNLRDLLKGKFPEPSFEISMNPGLPIKGDAVKVNWKARNVDFVRLDGKEVETSGFMTIVIKKSVILDFEYGTEVNELRLQHPVKAGPSPQISRFKATDPDLAIGGSTLLEWEVKHATRVLLLTSKETTEVTGQNSIPVSPAENTLYRLVAYATNNTTTVEDTATVSIVEPITIDFGSENDFIIESLSSVIKWNVKNATEVKIFSSLGEVFDKPLAGELAVIPAQTVTYTLTAKNIFYSKNALCTIIVDPKPRIDLLLPKIIGDGQSLVPSMRIDGIIMPMKAEGEQIFKQLFEPKHKRSSLITLLRRIISNKV